MYCNTTSDLNDVYPNIGRFQHNRIFDKFTLVSGTTFYVGSSGYVELVLDDGVQLTEKTSIATVNASAGSFWYDTDNDLLYIQTVDQDDLTASSIPLIEGGVDWDDFKTRMLNDAEEEIDSYLTRLFITPLLPRLVKRHSSNDYEAPIRLSAAYLTCRNIIRRLSPNDPISRELGKYAINSNPTEGEEYGFIDKILKGEIYLQDQKSPADVGSVGNVDADSDNSGTGYIWVSGNYTGANQERWRLQIDTAGAPGTATYKLSYDGGSSWDVTLKETFNTDNNNRRIRIGRGIEVVFYGAFVLADKWDFDVFPSTDRVERPMISSTRLVRG